MVPKYEIVNYTPEFKNHVVQLQTNSWSPSVALNAAYLEWKYERNPYSGDPLIYLALCDGQVVGMRGLFGVKWEVGLPPRTFLGHYADDLVIAPDHRNRGLVTKIMRAALNDLGNRGSDYVYNLSAGNITILNSLAVGWRSVGLMHPWQREAKRAERFDRLRKYVGGMRFFWRYANSLPLRHWAAREEPLFYLDRNRGRRRYNFGPSISLEQNPKPVAMAELVERIKYDGRIRHVRDSAYFSWRFQNPLHRYRFLFWEGVRLEGYLVLKENISTTNLNKVDVHLVDWEATSLNIRAELLRAAINWGNFPRLIVWSATLPDETKSILKEAGFTPMVPGKGLNEHHPCILMRPVKDELLDTDWIIADRRFLDLANWDVRIIYSMYG